MKTLPVLLLLVSALAARAQTTNLWFKWNYSVSTGIIGYRIWQGDVGPGYYNTNYLVGLTNRAEVKGLSLNKPYWFITTALMSDQESPPSNEVTWMASTKPNAPGMLRVESGASPQGAAVRIEGGFYVFDAVLADEVDHLPRPPGDFFDAVLADEVDLPSRPGDFVEGDFGTGEVVEGDFNEAVRGDF